MNEETLIWILSISGTIIILLLGIITFFLQKFVNSVDEIKAFVNTLRVSVAEDQIKFNSFMTNHYEQHKTIDRRLNDHSRRLDEHSIKIARKFNDE